jgi:hypothetical protein
MRRVYVPVSTTHNSANSILTTGGPGSVLQRIIATVITSGASGVSISDDSANTAQVIVPFNAPVGVHTIELGAVSKTGNWHVSTASGVALHCIVGSK